MDEHRSLAKQMISEDSNPGLVENDEYDANADKLDVIVPNITSGEYDNSVGTRDSKNSE